jgi:hypothetical protein
MKQDEKYKREFIHMIDETFNQPEMASVSVSVKVLVENASWNSPLHFRNELKSNKSLFFSYLICKNCRLRRAKTSILVKVKQINNECIIP